MVKTLIPNSFNNGWCMVSSGVSLLKLYTLRAPIMKQKKAPAVAVNYNTCDISACSLYSLLLVTGSYCSLLLVTYLVVTKITVFSV